jgi:hypothetical protein
MRKIKPTPITEDNRLCYLTSDIFTRICVACSHCHGIVNRAPLVETTGPHIRFFHKACYKAITKASRQ